MDILEELFKLEDKEYAKFAAKLAPTIDSSLFIGVRVPDLRKLAKKVVNTIEGIEFINNLPHKYYEENILHSLILNEMKDYDKLINLIEDFLPYVDNWAVCDLLNPKVFKKHRDKLISKIYELSKSKEPYTIRFSIGMLMGNYLDEDFKKEYLDLPASIISNEYYVNMMLAWYYATALAKQYEYTIKYIEENKLSVWVHNKTIQKAKESFRVSDDKKAYLNSLKRK